MKSKSGINKKRKEDVKLKGENRKFNHDYTVIPNKCNYNNYTENKC
jgi:hypothetical protein